MSAINQYEYSDVISEPDYVRNQSVRKTPRTLRVHQSFSSYFCTGSCFQSISTQNVFKLPVYSVFPITLPTRYNLLSAQCSTTLSCILEIISEISLIFCLLAIIITHSLQLLISAYAETHMFP